MKYFVTGATGFIGMELTKQLLNEGAVVHALVRSESKAKSIGHKNLKLFTGEVTEVESIKKACEGCDYVFHLAGYAKPWSKDKNIPEKINVTGTANVLEAAFQNKIKRVVFTSTAGTLSPSVGEEKIDESSADPISYLTDYEKTKKQAEILCLQYIMKGLDVVIVNPSRVYGPGLLSKSNSVTTIIQKYKNGKWRFLPGTGKEIGNYVFIGDVVKGHVLALENGQPGERYLLGGENVSFNKFFEILSIETGRKLRLFHLPLWTMLLVSHIMLLIAKSIGSEPLITPQWVKRYKQNRLISNNKAIKDINYTITPLNEGIAQTLNWLKGMDL